jgi:hypothetical protein
MRTFLVCTLRVTISPWNSLPDFLKEPMLAMSLLVRQECRVGTGTRVYCPCEVGDLALNAPQRGEESRWVR